MVDIRTGIMGVLHLLGFVLRIPTLALVICVSTAIAEGAGGKDRAGEKKLSPVDSLLQSLDEKTPHFEPIADRWRGIKLQPYQLNVKGHILDPYNQNILKGDFPVIGQDLFFILTASSQSSGEAFGVPTPSAISTSQSNQADFFGSAAQLVFSQNLLMAFEFYKGDTAYRPRDFEIKVAPVFNLNYANTRENSNVNINVQAGTLRNDGHVGFQELFVEKHLMDLSAHYDFVSAKAGIQPFNSDFRGLIFNDFNLGFRLFGNAAANRYQYNLAAFRMLEKDTNSELNTVFDSRDQDVFIFNLYKQDFLTLGYTAQLSLHYNHDKPSRYIDNNGVPVRPPILGNSRPHDIKAVYLGFAGDGHFGRINITHAIYQVVGRDTFNPVAGQALTINAQLAALELSMDRDWMRFRLSALYASGDANPNDGSGHGFDTIVDSPFFAGGPFSYWNSRGIRLLGVNLTNKASIVPNLRPSKFEGQANFVNPGLVLLNLGYDADLTPKARLVLNANYLRFSNTASLGAFVNQGWIGNAIGLDYGIGVLYRPFLNNNARFTVALTGLMPMSGFKDLYESPGMLLALTTTLTFTY